MAKLHQKIIEIMKNESFKKGICQAPTAVAQYMNVLLGNDVPSHDAFTLQATYIHFLFHYLDIKSR